MRTFRVYSTGQNSRESEPILIEDSFSFKAVFFNLLWFVYHGLWLEILIFTIVQFLLNLVGNFVGYQIYLTLQILSFLAIGIFASQIRIMKLLRQGYKLKDIIIAKNPDKARLKFFKNCVGGNYGS